MFYKYFHVYYYLDCIECWLLMAGLPCIETCGESGANETLRFKRDGVPTILLTSGLVGVYKEQESSMYYTKNSIKVFHCQCCSFMICIYHCGCSCHLSHKK
jgi:hypothetical protein